MEKENVVFIYGRILFSHKKEGSLTICNNLDMQLEGIMLSEISQTRKAMYDITDMWNLKKSKTKKTQQT